MPRTWCRRGPAGAQSEASASLLPPVECADVDLVRYVDECLGNLDAAVPLLKAKTGAGKLDFNQAKAKVAELSDLATQLKAALAEQLRRGKTLAPALLEVQMELNGRLRS